MENPIDEFGKIRPEFDFDDLVDFSVDNDETATELIRDASSEATASQTGVYTNSLQSAIDNYAHEEYSFLAEQIKYVDAEINLLRERQGELTAFTAVDDIINLEKLCGYDLGFNTADNAKSLLTKISDALKSYQGDDSAEKFALLRLKVIIQEGF